MANNPIQDVSDTAFWVAYFRSLETESEQPLFRDPLAKVLLDDRGKRIAESMSGTSEHTKHNVLIRTVIIDRFVQELVAKGADIVVNLGAGLDTRPYRLDLPAGLRWIEVDYPHMMSYKDTKLAKEKPKVNLEREPLDLADRAKRRALFATITTQSKKAVILTEGVLPYLTEEQVAELSEDLRAQESFRHWIADYISPKVYKYLQTPKRMEQMKNAPFRFMPADYFGFFTSRNWKIEEIRYIPEVAHEVGRPYPRPWYAPILGLFMSKEMRATFQKISGYMILGR